jgi:hypothetical protein
MEDLTKRVPLIVVGRCDELQSAWNAENTLITTTATYSIERVVKGRHASRDLAVQQLGGTVGPITQAVLGGPRFRVGERSLLFLVPDGAGQMRVYGLARGKQDVHRDPSSGVDRVRLDDGVESRLMDVPLDALIKTMLGAGAPGSPRAHERGVR